MAGASAAKVAQLESKLEKTYQVEKIDHQELSRQIQRRIRETKLLKELREAIEADL